MEPSKLHLLISDDVVQRLLKFFLNKGCFNSNLFDVLIEYNKDMSDDSLKHGFCADAYIPGIMEMFVYLGSDCDQNSIEDKQRLLVRCIREGFRFEHPNATDSGGLAVDFMPRLLIWALNNAVSQNICIKDSESGMYKLNFDGPWVFDIKNRGAILQTLHLIVVFAFSGTSTHPMYSSNHRSFLYVAFIHSAEYVAGWQFSGWYYRFKAECIHVNQSQKNDGNRIYSRSRG